MLRRLRAGSMLALALLTVMMPPARSADPTTVTVGVSGDGDMVPLLYAQERGLFEKAGLNVRIDRSAPGGTAVALAVSAGSYDIGKGNPIAVFSAYSRGIPFVIIGTALLYESKTPNGGLIVRSDSPIRTPVDLQNGVVGLASLHGVGELATCKALATAAGSCKTIQFTELPMSSAMVAVETRRAVAAEVANPLMAEAVKSGRARLIPVYNSLGFEWPIAIYYTTKDYAAKHPDVIKAFAQTVASAARYTNVHKNEVAPMLAAFSGIGLQTIADMAWLRGGTGVDVEGLQRIVDAEVEVGMLPRRVSVEDLVDPNVPRMTENKK